MNYVRLCICVGFLALASDVFELVCLINQNTHLAILKFEQSFRTYLYT